MFTDCIISLCSDKAITNYIHILRAGHLKEMMETHGYLAYLSNGAPASNTCLEKQSSRIFEEAGPDPRPQTRQSPHSRRLSAEIEQ